MKLRWEEAVRAHASFSEAGAAAALGQGPARPAGLHVGPAVRVRPSVGERVGGPGSAVACVVTSSWVYLSLLELPKRRTQRCGSEQWENRNRASSRQPAVTLLLCLPPCPRLLSLLSAEAGVGPQASPPLSQS